MTTGENHTISGQPDIEYRIRVAVSQSILKLYYGVTPAEGRAAELTTKKPSAEMNQGTVISELNYPGFVTSVGAWPDVDGRTKEGKAARAEVEGRFPRYITAAEMRDCIRGWQHLNAHGRFQAFLAAPDLEKEFSIYWTDGNRKVPCKGRADLYSKSLAILADIKTTSHKLDDRNLKKIIGGQLWHGQLAWYRRGLQACGLPVDHCLLFVVGLYDTYPVRCIRLNDNSPLDIPEYKRIDLQTGEDIMLRLLETYTLCVEKDCFPGYGHGIDSLM